MEIKKIRLSEDIHFDRRCVRDFGVSFKIEYEIFTNDSLEIDIMYSIFLVENESTVIGKIDSEYVFFITEINDISTIVLDPETENRIVRWCLKANHFNIKDDIDNVLQKHMIKINDDSIFYMN